MVTRAEFLPGLQVPARAMSPTVGSSKSKLVSKPVDALGQAPGPHPGFRDPGARLRLWKSMGAKGFMCITHKESFPKVIADAHGSSTAKNGGIGGEQGCGQPPPPDRVPAVRSCRCASGSFGRTPGGSHHGLTTEEEEEEAEEEERGAARATTWRVRR